MSAHVFRGNSSTIVRLLTQLVLVLALCISQSGHAMDGHNHGNKQYCSCWQDMSQGSQNFRTNHMLCLDDTEVLQLRNRQVTVHAKELWARRDRDTDTKEGKYSFILCSQENLEKLGLDHNTNAWTVRRYPSSQKTNFRRFDGTIGTMFGSSVFESNSQIEIFDVTPDPDAMQREAHNRVVKTGPSSLQKTLKEAQAELKQEDFLTVTIRHAKIVVTTFNGTINHWGDGTQGKDGYVDN